MHTGVDFAGLLYIKTQRIGYHEKRFGFVYLPAALQGQALILTLLFKSWRSIPHLVISDNRKTFKAVDKMDTAQALVCSGPLTWKRIHDGRQHPSLKQGDTVIVHNDKCLRGFWKLAKIEELLMDTLGVQ